MKRNANINLPALLVMAGVGFLAFSVYSNGVGGSPLAPEPVNPHPNGPDLYAVFRKGDDNPTNVKWARDFAKLCHENAHAIEFDGSQEEKHLKTGRALNNVARMTRYFQKDGVSYQTQYPDLKGVLETFLNAAVGTDGGPITDAERAKWVTAFRVLGDQATYAADKMEWEG